MLITYITRDVVKEIEVISNYIGDVHVVGNRIFFEKHEIGVFEEYGNSDRHSLSNFVFTQSLEERNRIATMIDVPVIHAPSGKMIVDFVCGKYIDDIDRRIDEIHRDIYKDGKRTSTCGDLIARVLSTEDYKVYLEIGIFRGTCLLEIGKICPHLHLYGMDIYTRLAENTFRGMFPTVHLVQGDFNTQGDELINSLPEKPDVVFYDADHSKSATENAIKIITKHLQPGGMIILHDTLHYDHLCDVVESIPRDRFDVITFGAENRLDGLDHRRGLTFCRYKG